MVVKNVIGGSERVDVLSLSLALDEVGEIIGVSWIYHNPTGYPDESCTKHFFANKSAMWIG